MSITSVTSSQLYEVKKSNRTDGMSNTGITGNENLDRMAIQNTDNNVSSHINQETQINNTRLKVALDVANSKMKHASTRCEFSYHEPTKRVSIKVIDKATDEVIREIPPEETLAMVEKIWELAGLLVDEKC